MARGESVGQFSEQRDIGAVSHPGSAQFDSASGAYTVTGGGANMWFTNDAFHFVYKKMSGEVRFSADARFLGEGGNAHKKACLILRQSLDPDSAYVDIALHGNGLTAVQSREKTGGNTSEVVVTESGPSKLQIEKRGRFAVASFGKGGGTNLAPAGGELPIDLQDPYYIGIGVCAHEDSVAEKAEFTNVKIESLAAWSIPPKPGLCSLEVVPLAGDRRAVCVEAHDIRPVAWSADGKTLVFQSGGATYSVDITNGAPPVAVKSGPLPEVQRIATWPSPDGKWIAQYFTPSIDENEMVLAVRAPDAEPPGRILAKFFWGRIDWVPMTVWSPDSKRIAFTSNRPEFRQ